MAVSKIKKFHIFAHLSIKELLLKELQKLECVEIMELDKKTAFHDWKNIKDEDKESNVVSDLNRVKFCIDLFSKYQVKESKGLQSLLTKKEIIKYDDLVSISKKTDYELLHQQCKEFDKQLNQIKLSENKLKAIAEELNEWKELEIDLISMNESKYIEYYIGSIANNNLEKFTEEVIKQSKYSEVKIVKEGKNTSKIIIITLKENRDKILNITQKYHFENYKYTHPYTGTPAEIIKKINELSEELSEKKVTIEKQLIEISNNNKDIYKIYDYLSINKEKDEISRYLIKSENTFVIKGWIQEKDIQKLKHRLSDRFTAFEIIFSDPKKKDKVPVALENHKLVQPFEVITELYSLPNYFEVDPTPILSIYYFIFFGFCLSDVGYGVVLAILSYLAIHKLSLGYSAKKFFRLLYYCGIAGAIGGIFVGSWFGDILNYLPPAFSWIRNIMVDKLSLFNPTENPIPLLILSIALGVIQVYTGIILKFLDNVKRGKMIDGLMDQISWLLLLTGIILFLIKGMLPSIFGTIAILFLFIGVFTLITTQGRTNKNIIMRIGSGILSLYDITSYFSDVLSYSRLFALSLATGIIATMFNMLATMANIPYIGIIITIIILFIGHVFNLLISGLSAFIHDARLQYVEFFTKFYQAGGIPFKPFSLKTTYTKVEEIDTK